MSHHHPHGHEHHGHGHGRGPGGLARSVSQLAFLWRSPVSDAVVAQVRPQPGERVVDLGAGMGPATLEAARSGAHVLAVDPSAFMRRMLSLRLLASLHRGHVTLLDGAAESLPLDAASIDALWTVNTVHHWTSVARAAAELRRVLRPGGRLLLVDEAFDDPAHPFSAQVTGHAHRFADVDPVAIAALLREHGFVDAVGGFEQVAGRPARVIRATAPSP